MSTLGVSQNYERFQSSYRNTDDEYKRPPLPSDTENYRIRHAYRSPYLSKDPKAYTLGRSNSCAIENRYRNFNDRTEQADDKNNFDLNYQRPYLSGQRKIYSAEDVPRGLENERKYNFESRRGYTKTYNKDSNISRISSYDNLFSRITDIEKQVQELKGQEFNTYTPRPTAEDYSRKSYQVKSTSRADLYGSKDEGYRRNLDEEMPEGRSGIMNKYDSLIRDDSYRKVENQEIERLNRLLRQEKEKTQLLSAENERLKQSLSKCETELAKLKESPKKTPKKVSFNSTVVERSSSNWRDQFDDQNKYKSPYEEKYDFLKYKTNDKYSERKSPVYNGVDKYKDYGNYKPTFEYDNYMKSKEKNQIDTSSQYSGGTDAILQSADSILKENSDFLVNMKNEYSRPPQVRSYTKSAQPKKRLMTPRNISDLKLGDVVKFERQDGKFACGTVRYKGAIESKAGNFVGIELDQPSGKNDGSLDNKRYFYCQRNYGLFIQFDKILVCWTD